jgi:hypothetical protein
MASFPVENRWGPPGLGGGGWAWGGGLATHGGSVIGGPRAPSLPRWLSRASYLVPLPHALAHVHTPKIAPPPPRLIPQTKADLKEHLRRLGSKPYEVRLSDMHLLLWLTKQPNMDPGAFWRI